MKTVKLGSSDLQVSEVCLGSMTWGNQNTQDEAFAQIDYALERGINFIDTAEMYAVPPSKETSGLTETYIGNWIATNKSRRDEFVLATKIAGVGIPWIRDGGKIDGDAIRQAVDGSLRRLQTDYIDLYQLHWPNRMSPHFSKHWPGQVDPTDTDIEQERAGLLEILQALDEMMQAGKIRHIGLSDDTPWGISEYLRLAELHDLPKMVSIQNEFSLLHLKDWPYLIENCVFNDVAYLPWSPLAGGALSGKYANGAKPAGCRWTMQQRNGIFRDTAHSHEAIAAYKEVADQHDLSLVQLSLAWVYQLAGVTSTIIGATSMEQLAEDLDAYSVALSAEVLADIDGVIKRFPQPF
ncbi:aldo/keto reductase [Arenicella xantha]|uniref:Aryl-alcohol dehydrogenase-like predicted oxidoreductase n=1 Tax=Arenicella xantha TaxID=644221 RepID=A0A395JP65_9GAMM|nr:aldo/keto reductase [Arenicella xantha]RBP53399.1 aryl-alcohol dehydrogenase-like predicted oxidoreductase [Arenicella xantha]